MYLLKSTYVTFCICPSGHVFNSNPSQNYLSSTPTASYSQNSGNTAIRSRKEKQARQAPVERFGAGRENWCESFN